MLVTSYCARRRNSILIASACTALAAIGWPALCTAQVAVTSSNDVMLTQVDYENDVTSDFSSTGQLIINESQLAADTGVSNGYINIADSHGNWLAQNVPTVAGSPVLAAQLNLGTPDGTNETGQNVNLSIDVSAQPLTTFTPTSPTAFNIAGEEVDSNAGEGAAAKPAPPSISNLPFNQNGITKAVTMANMPNVQAADNQCGPASIANSLAWLAQNKGLLRIDPNNPGRGALANTLKGPNAPNGAKYAANTIVVPNGTNSSTQTFNPAPSVTPFAQALPYGNYTTNETVGPSLVGMLDLKMGRVTQNRADYYDQTFNSNVANRWDVEDVNGSTTGQTQTVGVENYLGSAPVNDATAVVIDTQGNITSVTNSGITNNAMGAKVTPQFLFDELTAQHTVKLGYTGHAVVMIATGTVQDVPWVLELSDLSQTSQNDALDAKLNSFLPFGIASSASIPLFSFMDTSTATPTLVGFGSNVSLFNAIAIGVVPEPSTIALLLGGAMLMSGRKRRI